MYEIDMFYIIIGVMGILKFIYYKNLGINPKVNYFLIIHEHDGW